MAENANAAVAQPFDSPAFTWASLAAHGKIPPPHPPTHPANVASAALNKRGGQCVCVPRRRKRGGCCGVSEGASADAEWQQRQTAVSSPVLGSEQGDSTAGL